MIRKLLLPVLCLCACTVEGLAADTSRYVEFARAYGIVRYFSPNPYTQKWSESDWLKVCALLADRTGTQPLEKVFEPLAPTLILSEKPVPEQTVADGADTAACYYCHSGSGELKVPFVARLFMPGLAGYIPYYKRLATVAGSPDSVAVPVAGLYYAYGLADGKYLNIQHSLPKQVFDKAATRRLLADAVRYWDNHRSADKSLSGRRSFIFGLLTDKAVRVADLTVRWNIIRHFYPYYEEDALDWDNRLETFMQEALRMGPVDSVEALIGWHDMVCRLFNPVKDGHLFVRSDMHLSGMRSAYLPEYYAAAETIMVNDTMLVRMRPDDGQPWRMLHTVDGRPSMGRMNRCRSVTNAATEAHRDVLAVRELFSAPAYGTPFVIASSGLDGDLRVDTLRALYAEPPVPEHENQPVRKYGNGILYVDATSADLNEKLFLSSLTPDIRALCFDLRGLPSVRFEEVLSHLIPSDAAAPATEVPVNRFPFQQGESWRIGAETLKAKSPHVSLPAIFLCDASTVSWGETVLMMVRHYGLGKIVGQPTAGTTGDMTQFDLPLFPFSMTGMRMHCMDGEEHHARGIVPDSIVPLHARDYMDGCDRTLHTALDMCRRACER